MNLQKIALNIMMYGMVYWGEFTGMGGEKTVVTQNYWVVYLEPAKNL